MRRVSIYLLFAMGILCAYGFTNFYLSRQDWVDHYRTRFAEQAVFLRDEGILAKALVDANSNLDDLQRVLDSRKKTGAIDLWILNHNDVVHRKSMDDIELANVIFDPSKKEEIVLDAHRYAYYTQPLNYGFSLTVGLRYNESAFLSRHFDKKKGFLFKYFSVVVLVVVAVFIYFFRDIMASIRQITSRKGRSFQGIHAKSREADLLLRGFSAYEDRTNRLEEEKKLFSYQVLPSLRAEITSGREPPYEFACTLVRTDINNFSKIYNEHPVEEFAATINDFFTDVSHVVARYHGLVHEFVGDEVIYYFKDQAVGNSVATALSAIRDINEVASRYNRMTLKERGYPFTVKSSFAHGSLRFGRFVNGFNLAGPSLIETVRVLSQVAEKDGNVVVFDGRHVPAANDVALSEFYATVKLKGFADEKILSVYRGHRPIEDFLIAGREPDFESLAYYRSDEDLTAILSWARLQNAKTDFRVLTRVIALLRQVPVTKTNGIPQQMLLLWIDDLTRELDEQGIVASGDRVKVLSSSLRLIENLVPPSEFTHQFESSLNKALKLDDRRVVANALEALTLFRREYEPQLTEKLVSHPDNRVAANALVHEGTRMISPFVVKRLNRMLDARSVATISSGLYAMGEIARHHRENDLVYYQTQVDFLQLVQELPDFVRHADVMVRRQALVAARKCADATVNKAIWRLVKGDASLEMEVRENLGGVASASADQAHKRAA